MIQSRIKIYVKNYIVRKLEDFVKKRVKLEKE